MSGKKPGEDSAADQAGKQAAPDATPETPGRPREIGGRKGPDPTRFGDWEKNGRCVDF